MSHRPWQIVGDGWWQVSITKIRCFLTSSGTELLTSFVGLMGLSYKIGNHSIKSEWQTILSLEIIHKC